MFLPNHTPMVAFPASRSLSCARRTEMRPFARPRFITSANFFTLRRRSIVRVVTPNQAAISSSRSEEHTSELQSHLNLVCRLLLEKKKHETDCTPARPLACHLGTGQPRFT